MKGKSESHYFLIIHIEIVWRHVMGMIGELGSRRLSCVPLLSELAL